MTLTPSGWQKVHFPSLWLIILGEFINEVRVKAAKVVDNVQFVTNRGRTYGGGGTGGYYNVYTGTTPVNPNSIL